MRPTVPFTHQTKQRYVYTTLRDRIIHCTLVPGQRLIIEEIATQLGVSPIPVREALQLLQSEGLIESTPHTGAIVAPISTTSVTETFAVLEGLELVSTRIAAERLSDSDHLRLNSLLERMDAVLAAPDLSLWGDLNTMFHQAIVEITALPLMIEMTARALIRWDRIRRYFAADVLAHRALQSQTEHHAIVNAMVARAFPDLESLVKRHNQSATAAYLRHIAARSDDVRITIGGHGQLTTGL